MNCILTHISLFSGIGGFDIAGEKAGFRSIATVEKNIKNREYLKFILPEAQHYKDVDTFLMEHAKKFENEIDVISGGDPCQPHSNMGKQLGKADIRYKWPTMLATIEAIRPTWVINENVTGTISNMVTDQKIIDLESKGYSCQVFVLPISALGADHRRNRVFILAHTESTRHKAIRCYSENSEKIFEAKSDWGERLHENGLHDLCPITYREFRKGLYQPALAASKDGLPIGYDKHFLEAAGNLVSPGIAYILFSMIRDIELHYAY